MNLCRLTPWIVCLSLLVASCAPSVKVTRTSDFTTPAPQNVMYVLPFDHTLVPDVMSEQVFNDFVDLLNRNRQGTGINWFYIMKDDLKEYEPGWLGKQARITGEIWSYIEDRGCCSTEMRIRGRVLVFEPGKTEPSLELFVPVTHFFEHDTSTAEKERGRLAAKLATEMADQVIRALRISSAK